MPIDDWRSTQNGFTASLHEMHKSEATRKLWKTIFAYKEQEEEKVERANLDTTCCMHAGSVRHTAD